MKAFVLTVLVLGITTFFPQAARADFEQGDVIPPEVIAPLMAWVEQETGVRVPVLPHVVANHEQLSNIVSHMGRIAGRARAVYIRGNIVLDERYFDNEDDTQISLLVHELVHYAQSFKPRSVWACANAKEVEAYTLQNKWLEERDHAPFVRASWVNRMASCPTDTAVAVASAE